MIQSFNVETKAPLTTYNRSVRELAFLDNHTFISSNNTNAFIWNVDISEPFQTIELENDRGGPVMAMSQTMFLITDDSLI